MTYVVLDNCIKCKFTDCVVPCPVDCFYEGANMLVIDPEVCTDCGLCEPECPAKAIKPDTAKNLGIFPKLNADMAMLRENEMRLNRLFRQIKTWRYAGACSARSVQRAASRLEQWVIRR